MPASVVAATARVSCRARATSHPAADPAPRCSASTCCTRRTANGSCSRTTCGCRRASATRSPTGAPPPTRCRCCIRGRACGRPESVGATLLAALQQAAPPRCRRHAAGRGAVGRAGQLRVVRAPAAGRRRWTSRSSTPAELDGDDQRRVGGASMGGAHAHRRAVSPARRRRAGRRAGACRSRRALLLPAPPARDRWRSSNAPGNGVGDDKAMYAFVPTMIRYYLGEDQIIGDVGTWVLADPNQYEGVRDRLRGARGEAGRRFGRVGRDDRARARPRTPPTRCGPGCRPRPTCSSPRR